LKAYYEHNGIEIYHGDCREVLPQIGPVDLVLTDPPYGHSYSSNHGASWEGTVIENDGDTSLRDWLIQSTPKTPMIIFGTWKLPRPASIKALLIWDKGPAFGMGDLAFPFKNSFEEIYLIGEGWTGKRDEGVIKGHLMVSWESKGRCHPNQKPVSLVRYLLSKIKARTVIDPFMGSGTTLRAAKDLGLKAIGIEIDERYCEIAAKRLSQEVLSFASGE
jgi:DNA modification methylase